MTVSAQGVEGATITADDQRVVIQRAGVFARVRQGAQTVVFLRDVTGVHVQPPRMGFRGFLQVLVGGEGPTTWAGATQHPRCVYFDRRGEAAMSSVAEFVTARVSGARPVPGTGLDTTGTPIGPPPEGGDGRPTAKPIILVVTSNPKMGGKPLGLDCELNRIRDALEGSPHGRRFALELRPAARVDELVSDLLEYPPTVLHFSGHGVVAGLIMTAPDGTSPVLANPLALAHLVQLAGVRANLRALLLNVCLSAEQAQFLATLVPVVVGTVDNVHDHVAIAFARGFYAALGNRLPAGEAFRAGRAQAALVSPEGAALYMIASAGDPAAVAVG